MIGNALLFYDFLRFFGSFFFTVLYRKHVDMHLKIRNSLTEVVRQGKSSFDDEVG